MELTTSKIFTTSEMETFVKQIQEFNLICYASEAAKEMEFEDLSEFHEAVQRSMELCLTVGIPLEGNFKQVYKCSYDEIEYDWKLSVFAYRMVCLNGGSSNANVARMQIELLKNYNQHH
ncbi:MAG: damage-inducible protein D [Bacteroidota bacterium]|nr:damage-inducible protein D [Bacteroidota bacterium]